MELMQSLSKPGTKLKPLSFKCPGGVEVLPWLRHLLSSGMFSVVAAAASKRKESFLRVLDVESGRCPINFSAQKWKSQ